MGKDYNKKTDQFVNKNHYQDKLRVGDYTMVCDTCGFPTWASDITKLTSETGKGGCMVCPNCVDAVDYALVPWRTPAEKNIPVARPPNTNYPTGPAPINASTTDPMSINNPEEDL